MPEAPDTIFAAVDPLNDQQVDIHWHNNPNNEDGFILERASDSSFTQGLKSYNVSSADQTVYVDSGIVAGQTYYYRVQSTLQANASGWSPTATVAIPGRITFASDEFINGSRGNWMPEPWAPFFNSLTDDAAEFITDQRGFGQFNGRFADPNARIATWGWIDVSAIGHATTAGIDYAAVTEAGYSQQRKRTGTRGGMTPWVYSPWQRADINNGAPIVTNPNPLTTDITFTPRGAYPYIPLAPTIGYDITFEFTTNAARTTFKVSLFGDRTKFPDGEGYIDRHVVYQDPSWWSGPNFYDVNSFKTFSVGPLTIDPLQN